MTIQGESPITNEKVGVLIVRDEEEREAIGELMNSLTIKVHHAQNSHETIMILEDNFCDFLIMDMQLPDKNGLAMLGKLRESVNLQSLPIIVISDEPVVVSLENVTTVVRPVALVRLKNIIESLLRHANSSEIDE